MKTYLITLLVMVMFLTSSVFGATDCKIADYPDHYEAVCVGDEISGIVPAQTAVRVQANITDKADAKTQGIASPQSDNNKGAVEQGPSQQPKQADVKAAKSAGAQTTVTALLGADKAPIVRRVNRRPNQVDLDAAKAARKRLILGERQKEPDIVSEAAPMQD